MSIADLVRARELEKRVAELERRVALIEEPLGRREPSTEPRPTPPDPNPKTAPSAEANAFVKNLARAQASRSKADDAA